TTGSGLWLPLARAAPHQARPAAILARTIRIPRLPLHTYLPRCLSYKAEPGNPASRRRSMRWLLLRPIPEMLLITTEPITSTLLVTLPEQTAFRKMPAACHRGIRAAVELRSRLRLPVAYPAGSRTFRIRSQNLHQDCLPSTV